MWLITSVPGGKWKCVLFEDTTRTSSSSLMTSNTADREKHVSFTLCLPECNELFVMYVACNYVSSPKASLTAAIWVCHYWGLCSKGRLQVIKSRQTEENPMFLIFLSSVVLFQRENYIEKWGALNSINQCTLYVCFVRQGNHLVVVHNLLK